MSTVVKDLGAVSAYAYAVEKGYTGTEAEFAELMASYATVGQTAVNAAQTATTKASEAATSATTATNKASEATTAATTATNKAAEAQADADAAALDASQALSAASTATTKATEATTAAATAVSAKDDAVSANTAAQSAKTAAQTAQTGAETAAASVQSSAEQIQTNADDISELKEDLDSVTDSTDNIIDMRSIRKAVGGAYVDGVATCTAKALDDRFGPNVATGHDFVEIPSGVREFVFTAQVRNTSSASNTNGLTIGFRLANNSTRSIKISNNKTDWTDVKIYSTEPLPADLQYLFFDYSSGGANVWAFRNVQLLVGTSEEQEYTPHLSALDIIARDKADKNADDIERILDDISTDVEKIYGIRINTDGTVDRVQDAVGKNNDYVVGSSFVGSGANDFDGIYPWSEIKTCSVSENSDGDKIITYEHESGFARDGSNGDVYVEIPKFFTKRYLDNDGNEIIMISGTRHGGFVVEPAFFDSETGEEIEHIYVGAYLTQTGINAMNSLSGVFPESNVSLDTLRTRDGEIYDFVTLQALQKLMSIEFGAVNLSSVFGGFSFLPWSSSVRADGSATNTNTGNFKGDIRIANIGVGNTVSIATSAGYVQNRTVTAVGEVTQVGGGYYRSISFDGDPVDLIDNSTMLYCSGQKTGFTDSLTYHTGRTNLNSGSTYSNQFRYRGIEGLWGTLGEIMDGIIVKDLKAYWSNIKSDYGDVTKCKRLNFAVPLQNTYTNSQGALPPQIKQMGWDFRYPTIAFPEVLVAKSGQYYGDLFFSVKNVGPDGQAYSDGDEFIGISSMAWDGHEGNGLYTLRFWGKSNSPSWLYGSRAIIRHLT